MRRKRGARHETDITSIPIFWLVRRNIAELLNGKQFRGSQWPSDVFSRRKSLSFPPGIAGQEIRPWSSPQERR